jgi:hypothetical protein
MVLMQVEVVNHSSGHEDVLELRLQRRVVAACLGSSVRTRNTWACHDSLCLIIDGEDQRLDQGFALDTLGKLVNVDVREAWRARDLLSGC